MKRLILIILVLILFCALVFSCIPSKKSRIRKSERLLERAVFLNPNVVKDSVISITDTIYIKGVTYDTITKVVSNDSTVVINNERLRVEYYFDSVSNNIFIEGECKDSILVKSSNVAIRTPYNFNKWHFKDYVLILLIALILLFILNKVVNFRRNH